MLGLQDKRWSLDGWDKRMISRDKRITGSEYKQQASMEVLSNNLIDWKS